MMQNILIDFSRVDGRVKPMHAVNNGPVGSKVRKGNSTYEYFREAGIPYARNHDAALSSAYGGEYVVDVHRIFCDFDADPTDPASYDFECTDTLVENTFSTGTEVYYRLGARIEHGKKVGTFPPKDFHKWAVICEHIIRHYTEGWANGFTYGITYWEIWNEPDCRNPDGSNPCWQGTDEEFVEFFCVALAHLKKCFPHLKIGGPAFCNVNLSRPERERLVRALFTALRERNLPLDFFSFHRYACVTEKFKRDIATARRLCDEYGYKDAELHLNEWNYIRSFVGDEWTYSLHAEKGLKGASFTSAIMAVGQDSALNMLMYYDARPCSMNGMFDTDFLTPLKGYYPFKFFGELYRMGGFVRPDYDESSVYCTAAAGNGEGGVMLTNFDDDDDASAKTVSLTFKGIAGKTVEIYTLDQESDGALTATVPFDGKLTLELPLYSVFLLKIR